MATHILDIIRKSIPKEQKLCEIIKYLLSQLTCGNDSNKPIAPTPEWGTWFWTVIGWKLGDWE